MTNSFNTWKSEEGLYVTTRFQKFIAQHNRPFTVKFLPKHALKANSELSGDDFEKMWNGLKEKGKVKEILVKYDDNGNIIQIHDPTHSDDATLI